MTLTREVGGVKHTENTRWPKELKRLFGLEGFKAYDTEHGFTTLILPNGFGVIVVVRSFDPEVGQYAKGDPALVGHLLMSHACRRHLSLLRCVDGCMRIGGHVAIADMGTLDQRIIVQHYETYWDERERRPKDRFVFVGEVDRQWVIEQLNEDTDLYNGFRF